MAKGWVENGRHPKDPGCNTVCVAMDGINTCSVSILPSLKAEG